MASDLRTTPQAICSVGMTVDGREVTEEHIDQMVETYNYAKYGARINLDHAGSWSGWEASALYNINLNGGMLGDVISLSKGKNADGVVVLYAILSPNASFVLLNQADQAVYYSVEIHYDFQGSGKAYLVGLAATDYPACCYTSRANFNRNQPIDNAVPNFKVSTDLGELSRLLKQTAPQEKKFSFKHLFNFNRDDDMNPEDLKKALTEALGEPLNNFAQTLEAQSKLLETFYQNRSGDDNGTDPKVSGDDNGTKPKSAFSKEDEERIGNLENGLGEIKNSLGKLSKLIQDVAGQESDTTTSADEEHNNSDEFSKDML